MLLYLLGGSFIDDLAFMILATPFYPAVIKLGHDPYGSASWWVSPHDRRVIPPVAICVFVVKNITGVPFNTIYKGCCPSS
jgi:TRAP-type C4-dicarboxylate transport system permease large subunit